MKTVLITRPEEEAEPLAAMLAARGFTPLSEPLLRIEFLPENKPALEAKPQAIITTSKRGVQALAEMTAMRDIPLFCVGIATAHYAVARGYSCSVWAETAEMLAGKIADSHAAASLLYVRGEDIHFDIAPELERKGFRVDSAILYRAVAAQAFSAPLCSRMAKGHITGALFFSQRTAQAYVGLVQKHGLAQVHRAMRAVCISEAVASRLREVPWHALCVADAPDMEQMMGMAKTVF